MEADSTEVKSAFIRTYPTQTVKRGLKSESMPQEMKDIKCLKANKQIEKYFQNVQTRRLEFH